MDGIYLFLYTKVCLIAHRKEGRGKRGKLTAIRGCIG